jgi:hypothetical protein
VKGFGLGVPNVRPGEEVVADIQIGIELFTYPTLSATRGAPLGIRRLKSAAKFAECFVDREHHEIFL